MMLVNALDMIRESASELKGFPKIQVIVTGKGPQKEHYEAIFEQRNAKWGQYINIKTAWLEIDDYPKIVASADLGICMHYSSSGFDLPMKIVDMFSA